MRCWVSCVQLDPTATPIHEVEDIASLTADTSTTGAHTCTCTRESP